MVLVSYWENCRNRGACSELLYKPWGWLSCSYRQQGVGILFAPDEGKKTRKRIRKSLEGVSDNLRDRLTHLNEDLKEKKLKFKGTLEENVEKLLSKSSYKAEELINALERKLEDLKKANAKYQK